MAAISGEQFDALQKGGRLWMDVDPGRESSEREFEVGRTTHSEKYSLYTKRLYPIVDGVPDKKGAKWTLLKRFNGAVGLAHGDMAKVVYSFRPGRTDPKSTLVLTPVQEGPFSYRLKIAGKVGRTEVRGRTGLVHLNFYLDPRKDFPHNYTHIVVNKEEGGKLPHGAQRKVEDAVRLKFEELRDQAEQEMQGERRDRNPAPVSANDLARKLSF